MNAGGAPSTSATQRSRYSTLHLTTSTVSAFDPNQIDLNRITFAAQDGVDQFESLAREFLPAILGLDFDQTMLSDESTLGDFCGLCETREEFDAWGRKVLQRIEDRYGVRPADSRVRLVDLFRDIELQRRASTRQ
jgi:hypothetical protein